MPPRRSIRFLSAAIHTAIVAALVVGTQLTAPMPLPFPRSVLAYQDARAVTLQDIPLPAPERARPSPGAVASPNAAPTIAPAGITPESGLENSSAAVPSSEISGVESGFAGGVEGIGVTQPVPAPPPPAPAPIRPHSGMQQPAKIFDVAPVYPAVARAARVEGVVILEAVIDASGKVASAHVLRSIALLDQAALDAVRQWQFTPTLLNGQPVPVVLTVTVNFTLR